MSYHAHSGYSDDDDEDESLLAPYFLQHPPAPPLHPSPPSEPAIAPPIHQEPFQNHELALSDPSSLSHDAAESSQSAQEAPLMQQILQGYPVYNGGPIPMKCQFCRSYNGRCKWTIGRSRCDACKERDLVCLPPLPLPPRLNKRCRKCYDSKLGKCNRDHQTGTPCDHCKNRNLPCEPMYDTRAAATRQRKQAMREKHAAERSLGVSRQFFPTARNGVLTRVFA